MQLIAFTSALFLASGAVAQQFDPVALFSQIQSVFNQAGGDSNSAAVDLRNHANSLVSVAFTATGPAIQSVTQEAASLQASAQAIGATFTSDAASRLSQATQTTSIPSQVSATAATSTSLLISAPTTQQSATGEPVTGPDSQYPSGDTTTSTPAPPLFPTSNSNPPLPGTMSSAPSDAASGSASPGSASPSSTPPNAGARPTAHLGAGVAGAAGVIGLAAIL